MTSGIYKRTKKTRAILSKAHTGIPLSPEHCAAMSAATLGVPKTPEHSTAMVKYWSDQDNRDTQSMRGIQFRINNPKANDEHSRKLKDSEAAKLSQERQRGGNDMVKHHFIYDHDHPENHTIEITRSQHAAHHHWMKRAGLEVSHLNVTEENKNAFKWMKLL